MSDVDPFAPPGTDTDIPDGGPDTALATTDGATEGDDVSPSDIDGMGGTGLAEYVSYDALSEDERDTAFEGVLSLSNPDTSRGILQADWPGEEYERNIAFIPAVLNAVPGALEALRVAEVCGVADHPAFIRFLVSMGRMLATTSGDATTIGKGTKMTETARDGVLDRIDEIQERIEKAQAQGDSSKANRLYKEQQGLYAKVYGTEPAVGTSGGPNV